ncbi:MAG: AMP-dependent synthetase [Paracoccaceae bacterium]|nr:MAG: AMP-dependent synthetase [Paracoccaceae bacterium]
MSAIAFLLERLRDAGEGTAFIEADGAAVGRGQFLGRIARARAALAAAGVGAGDAVQLRGDFGADAAAWLLALWEIGAVAVPVAPTSMARAAEFAAVGDVSWIVSGPVAAGDIAPGPGGSAHPLYAELRRRAAPGLVIFTSGTSGTPKGAVHDAGRLLSKFHAPGKDLRTLAFLLFDHIAGIDTLLYALANASTLVCPPARDPATVMRCIAAHRVEVLPTAPSFLNMLLLSGAHEGLDLSALKIITYGAEMMPQPLLERVAAAFPGVRIVQKYGTSELGALRSRSAGDRSRWLTIGGAGTEWRVRGGLLEIRTPTAMLGYLNAPSPFTEDGFHMTGDRVEVSPCGSMIRFLGRESDIINVGGQKVFPAEVEAALRALPGIADAAVHGVPHPMLGACVCARIRPADPAADAAALRVAIRRGLAGVLEPYKIPQKIILVDGPLATERFKQMRG